MNNMLKANPLPITGILTKPNPKMANVPIRTNNPVTPPADSKSSFEKSEFEYF